MRSRYPTEPLHDPEPYDVAPGETCDCGSAVVLVEGERVCLQCWVVVGADWPCDEDAIRCGAHRFACEDFFRAAAMAAEQERSGEETC